MTNVMEDPTLNKRDLAVKDLPFLVLKRICVLLNIISQFFDRFSPMTYGLEVNPSVLIGAFLFTTLPYKPFPWKKL